MKKEKDEEEKSETGEESELESPRDDSGEPKIEDTETSIDEEQFHDFLKPSAESFSPVLEKVETSPRESLEQDVDFVPTSTGEEEDKQIQYSPVSYTESYTRESERNIESPVEESRKIQEAFSVGQPASINTETVGRDFNLSPRGVAFVNPESRRNHGNLEEKYVKAERIDMEKVGRESQESANQKFQGRVKKYEIR